MQKFNIPVAKKRRIIKILTEIENQLKAVKKELEVLVRDPILVINNFGLFLKN